MTSYLAPGIYVKEIAGGPRPIGRVGTSVPAFLGRAPVIGAHQHEVVAVNNWTEFVDRFVRDAPEGTHLSNAVFGYFANGGGRCYVVNIGESDSLAGTTRQPTGLTLLEAYDQITMVAAPGFHRAVDYSALIEHCAHPLRQDRLAILDTRADVLTIDALTRPIVAPIPDADGGRQEGTDDDGPAGGAVPDLPPDPAGQPDDGAGTGPDAGAPPPPETRPAGRGRSGGGGPDDGGLAPPRVKGGHACLYFPNLVMPDPVSGELVIQPPSGHIAGIWARVDGSRGVHKAPANEPIQAAVNLVHQVTRGEQEILNPAGVNCLRRFPEGLRVWGARTLEEPGGEYTYINVRRLTNMIKESIAEGIRWAMFEPNHPNTWGQLRRDIGAFLSNVWRDGALFGKTQDEAFFVKCDEETNSPSVRNEGRLEIIVGISVVRPAEFIVFKLMQTADQTEIENPGG